jgi:hypothetical protein
MMRAFQVTLSDAQLYCINVMALSEDDAIDQAQEIAETNEDDPRLRERGGSFHDIVHCVEVSL